MKRRLCLSIVVAMFIASGAGAQSDRSKLENEVRQVFDKWSTALTRGDKKTYLETFWKSPRLVIRVSNGEWRGFEAYQKRIEAAQLPPGNPADYRKVEVVALGPDAAVVTYERPAPAQAAATAGESVIFRGTVVFAARRMVGRSPRGTRIRRLRRAPSSTDFSLCVPGGSTDQSLCCGASEA